MKGCLFSKRALANSRKLLFTEASTIGQTDENQAAENGVLINHDIPPLLVRFRFPEKQKLRSTSRLGGSSQKKIPGET